MIQHSHSIHTPDGNCENNRKYEIMFNRGCSQRSFKFQVVSSNLVPNFSFYLRLQSKQQSFQTQIIVHKFVEFIFKRKNAATFLLVRDKSEIIFDLLICLMLWKSFSFEFVNSARSELENFLRRLVFAILVHISMICSKKFSRLHIDWINLLAWVFGCKDFQLYLSRIWYSWTILPSSIYN